MAMSSQQATSQTGETGQGMDPAHGQGMRIYTHSFQVQFLSFFSWPWYIELNCPMRTPNGQTRKNRT